MNPYRRFLLYCVSFLSLSLFSCHSDSNLHGFEYNFENLTTKPINIRVYSTLSDYYNNTNVFLSGRMDVRGYYSIPVDHFTSGSPYYVDWYSDDLLYTNWYWSNITLRTEFRPTYTDYEYLVNTVQFSDPSRKIWMKGLGTQTTWKAVDAYTMSGSTLTSVWSSLTAAQKNVQMVLNKDFSAHLLMQNASNQNVDSLLSYQPNYDSTNHVSVVTLLNVADTSVGTLTSNFSPSTLGFGGTDSVMLTYIKNVGYFQMVRQ